jgi:hypothetical protein
MASNVSGLTVFDFVSSAAARSLSSRRSSGSLPSGAGLIADWAVSAEMKRATCFGLPGGAGAEDHSLGPDVP